MALSALQSAVQSATIYLAVPVDGAPTAPPGTAGSRVNTLWSYLGWGFAVVAALLLVGALVTAMANHQSGRPNDGFGKVFIILGSCIAFGAIAGVVGGITGT